MRSRRRRWTMRETALAAAALAFAVSLLILWFGHLRDRETDRLAAEGQVTQGVYLETFSGSSSSASRGSDTVVVGYTVGGVRYTTSVLDSRDDREAMFQPQPVRVPRLGPEQPLQVVYLPSDPAVAQVRDDMSKHPVAIYAAAGLFALIGLVFGAMGLFVLRARRGLG
jgi:hypothetical protein